MKYELAPEFQFIRQYFQQLSGEGSLDLTDDAALLSIDSKYELVMTADTIVENVHFFSTDPIDLIARKLLRCNLSDLAGMGADPYAYLLTISLPEYCFKAEWLNQFTDGLLKDQKEFDVYLLGGDTTKNPNNMVLSVTMIGKVVKGQALRRNTANVGDGIWVTGTIGDSALGLLSLKGEVNYNCDYFIDRYHLPRPRLGFNLFDIVSAAMDISDGLLLDLGHLVRESRVGAIIQAPDIPLSDEARILGEKYFETCITGGDDYELLLTIPVGHEKAAIEQSKSLNIPLTKIGYCTDDKENNILIYDHNQTQLEFKNVGWSHI